MTVSEGEPRIIDTIFNVTGLVSNLFNNSNNALVTYVGGLVLFIVLVEIALYALDVYYNQTYNKNFFSQRNDNNGPHSIYEDYPPYPDPYISTFRSFSSSNNWLKIVEWIALLTE